ncbi:MAG TPA: type II toxin-antitoxin system ParD family antitoxin [Allocoleopsis sp.]
MEITLKPEQEQFIIEQVNQGRYNSINTAISEALTLLETRDQIYDMWLEETKKKGIASLEQLERGEGIDREIDRLQEKFRKLRELNHNE